MSKKALLLISGGLDSPVAGWLMREKGLEVYGIYFDNRPLADAKSFEKVKELSKLIGLKKLYVVPHGANQQEFMNIANTRFQCVFCKRLMYRMAECIAKEKGFDYLLTGENLGQVASQTLDNLTLNDQSVNIIVLRPLLTWSKQEIIDLGKTIGVYDISIQKSTGCKALPTNPVTKAKKEKILFEESKINIAQLIKISLEQIKEVTL
ncbi:hypothetical protein GOV04_04020 [Candidatus Woesearchaeota archaeon]|nr:hypothetical protein [Candidatus Woesearchaeota archaeon]